MYSSCVSLSLFSAVIYKKLKGHHVNRTRHAGLTRMSNLRWQRQTIMSFPYTLTAGKSHWRTVLWHNSGLLTLFLEQQLDPSVFLFISKEGFIRGDGTYEVSFLQSYIHVIKKTERWRTTLYSTLSITNQSTKNCFLIKMLFHSVTQFCRFFRSAH